MLLIIGLLVVFGCVAGGYAAGGGHFGVLWQPFEFLIIIGAGIGAYIIANPGGVLKRTGSALKAALTGPKYKKEHYIELLCLLFQVFKLVKSKGVLAIEQHVENSHESSLFQQFPTFHHDHHAVEFLCDYLRMMTLGSDKPHEMETLIDQELEIHHAEDEAVAGALQTMADGFPALGIVAAVLGVIHTMGSITEPPEILGKLIGAALVGTFSGILVAYGAVGPIAAAAQKSFSINAKYYECIKTALLAHMSGYAPAVSIEFARKTIPTKVRPDFYEVEKATGELPAPS